MNNQENIESTNLPINQLKHFANHPFKLSQGNFLDELVESIKNKGVIEPIIVRPLGTEENKYEILSGHNRFEAAKKVGFDKIPARIYKGLSEDKAMEIITETNFYQRSFADFSHSEKAKAITMRHNAIKRQGKRTDLTNAVDNLLKSHENVGENVKTKTSAEVPHKLIARDKIADEFGLNNDIIATYLRINELIPALLERLDRGEFKLAPAFEVSFLSKLAQEDLNMVLENTSYRLDTKKATMLKKKSKNRMPLTCVEIEPIFKAEEKRINLLHLILDQKY